MQRLRTSQYHYYYYCYYQYCHSCHYWVDSRVLPPSHKVGDHAAALAFRDGPGAPVAPSGGSCSITCHSLLVYVFPAPSAAE
eukprot:3760854-Rhodomonas_salina.1